MMSLSPQEEEIIEQLREISRLRRALALVKNVAELEIKDGSRIILKIVNETLGVE